MASEWPNCRLEELASPSSGSIAIGPFGSRLKADCYVSEGVAVIRGTNLGRGRTLGGEFVFITPEKAKELGNANLQPDDLVFPHRGAIGEVGIVPIDGKSYALSTSLMKIRLDPTKATPDFLYYYFRSKVGREELLKNASQVGTPGIATPLKSLRECTVPCPSVAEQRRVAEVLRSLDGRVDSLQQTNATLEAIAKALFKSWFVDFDPVRAKAEGHEPEGMDAATAALFPSEFEDSELGQIPKGWRISRFDHEFDFTMGQSPPGSTYNKDRIGAPFFQGCTDFGAVFPSERVYCSQPARFARAGDVLMSVRAPVGALNIASVDCSIGRGLCAIRHKSGSTGLTHQFVSACMARIERAAGEGALFNSLSKQQLASLPVLVANIDVTEAMASLMDALTKRRIEAARQMAQLGELRDILLPHLISGKLRIGHESVTSDEG